MDAVKDRDKLLVVEMLCEPVKLTLFVCVELVLEESLPDNVREDVPDNVALNDAVVVDDSETLPDNELVSSCDALSDLLQVTDADIKVVIVAVALKDNDGLSDAESVELCVTLSVDVIERLAVALVLLVVLVVRDVEPVSLGVEVLVGDIVIVDVNVVLLELL